MKKTLTFFGAISIATFLLTSCSEKKTETKNASGTDSSQTNKINNDLAVSAANDQLYKALNAMFTGNLEPMNNIWSHQNDVTDLGPFGGQLVGWDSVGAEFKKEAGLKLGGKVVCTGLIVHSGKDMGYTVCTEVGENMSAEGKPVVVSHRATNVFRLENGQWKLVHHHTDLSPQLQSATGTTNK